MVFLDHDDEQENQGGEHEKNRWEDCEVGIVR